jgi:hypothetical protein
MEISHSFILTPWILLAERKFQIKVLSQFNVLPVTSFKSLWGKNIVVSISERKSTD